MSSKAQAAAFEIFAPAPILAEVREAIGRISDLYPRYPGGDGASDPRRPPAGRWIELREFYAALDFI